jgi:cobalt-zinc-cadmium efflux system membrane fusion protein
LNFANRQDPLDAKIFLIGKEIGKDRTVKVHCHLAEENADIAPGSYFKASIYTSEMEHWTIPNESIVEMDGRKVVFIQQSSTGSRTLFKPMPIHILNTGKLVTAFEYEESSVPYDKKVVIKGAYDIMSEMLVTGEE